MPAHGTCRICEGHLEEFFDFGRQPLSDTFPQPDSLDDEFFFRLAVGLCERCTMVQLVEEVPRERMFHDGYPYYSSGSIRMQEHFTETAREMLATHLAAPDALCVEVGSNDGVMLKSVKAAGVRHLGIEPSKGVAEIARSAGVRVWTEFFDEDLAKRIVAAEGHANVVFSANTICHIPYLNSVLAGIRTLLAPGGAFAFEDPYLGDILSKRSFDQIYDEHFFLFSARSVQYAAAQHGLDLVKVEPQSVHGGEVRYSLALKGTHPVSPAVAELIEQEEKEGLADPRSMRAFCDGIETICADLVALLERLKEEGKVVVAYGATAKSATLLNYAKIGPDLVREVYDSTPAKIGRVMPGTHIPIVDSAGFRDCDADVTLLLAWNHAAEITTMEREFGDRGGRWVVYQPDVAYL